MDKTEDQEKEIDNPEFGIPFPILNLILNEVSEAVILIDHELRIISWNKEAEKIYGWKSSDVLRRVVSTILNFYTNDDPAQNVLDMVQSTKIWTGELFQKRKNGEICYIALKVFYLNHETQNFHRFCILGQDLTEKKKIQKKLNEAIEEIKKIELSFRRSNERYHALFNSINDMIFVHELRPDMLLNKLEEVNDAVFKTLHYNWSELTKLTPFTLFSDQGKLLKSHSQQLIQNKFVTFETTVIDKNQEKIPVELRTQILDLDGKESIISIAREIRERKALEESKRRILQDSLELNRIKSDIILWVFYELKTPLLNTQKIIETLLGKVINQSNPILTEIIQQITLLSTNIDSILNQITEFLNLSEDESHKVTLDFEETDLKLFLEETINTIKNANEKPIQIHISGENLTVQIDPTRIQHIFITIIAFLLNYTGFLSPINISWQQHQEGAKNDVKIEITKKLDDGQEFLLERHPENDMSVKICKNILLRHNGMGSYHINSETNEIIFEISLPIRTQ